MGTPGLISRWGLKTTATVGAAFRGFIPVPRANRIRPDRIWGGYRLALRSQRVIEWQCTVTRVCAQCPVIACVMSGSLWSWPLPRGPFARQSRPVSGRRSSSQPVTSSRVNRGVWEKWNGRAEKSAQLEKSEKPPPVPCGSSFGNPLIDWVPLV